MDTCYFIPHTHWEGAVFQTRAAYLEMGLPNILRALRLLETYPDYRFTLDQVCYVAPFLARYPAEAAAFRRFIAEGRLAIVGGTDVMLDVNMPGGESFVRQVLYGKRYFRDALGVDVTIGWALDTFGHHAQMPQLLKLAGYTSYWFARGVANREVPAEFLWEGLDGSRIPAMWLPHSYALLYDTPKTLPKFTAFVRERFDMLTPFSHGPERPAVSGADVSAPEAHVPALVAQFNAQPDRPCDLRLAVPAEFAAAVARRELPVVGGELNPIFQGIYSSRIGLKQRTRALEAQLLTAESLGARLAALGVATDQADVWRAWEPMLFNQAHDLMSGVMTDHVYADTLAGYDFSARLAEELTTTRAAAVAAHVDTRGDGLPVVVLNTLGWARTDLAVARVSFPGPGVRGAAVVDVAGHAVPCQLTDAVYAENGDLLQADVAFLAEVPALGHAVYHVRPADAAPVDPRADAVLESADYRLEIDALSGAITALTVKDGGWDALTGPANVVAMEPDHGDLWELYHPLDACSAIAMTERYLPPAPGAALFSTAQTAGPGTVTRGPVFDEFTVSHPFSAEGRFATRIRLYHGLRRIDIRTEILNHDERVRYRALFPTIFAAPPVHEIPFGALTRPDGVEYPAQNWVDCGDGTRGMALLNRGLPGNNVADGTFMLSLCRSTSIVAYGYYGGYEPWMASDTGLERGTAFTFDYALLPHAGDWRQAGVYRDGLAVNHPLHVMPADAHAGALPSHWAGIDISAPNVVVSAYKVGEEGRTVLRVYEAAGEAVDAVTVAFPAPLRAAEELNLVEDPLAACDVANGQLRFALGAFEIKTFGLTFAEPNRHSSS